MNRGDCALTFSASNAENVSEHFLLEVFAAHRARGFYNKLYADFHSLVFENVGYNG